ncbi:MAG: methyltransferase domain-containing protein [Nocardioides sp.]
MSGDQQPTPERPEQPQQLPEQQPHQRRSAARTVVVWEALRELLGPTRDAAGASADRSADRSADLRADPRPPADSWAPAEVVDIGGGTGGFAVRVAELGHRVAVVDPSPDALATLARRAEESGVADRVTAYQGDLGTLADLVPAGSIDVVLCHGVLEIVADPAVALATIAGVLRPGGSLSLLVNQRHAAVFARAMAGHFSQAQALLETTPDSRHADPGGRHADPEGRSDQRRFTSEEVTAVLDGAGFDTVALHAVRVFVDLVPSSLAHLELGATDRLIELERAVASRPEYLPLGTQVHALARRR